MKRKRRTIDNEFFGLIFGILNCLLAATAVAASEAASVPITALAFSPDGSALVSNGPQRVEIRSPSNATVQSHIPCDLAKITSLAFSPDGAVLAVAGGHPGVGGDVRLLDWRTRTILQRLTNAQDLATAVAFSGDGRSLAVASADHHARVWRRTGTNAPFREAITLSGHAGPVAAIAFSPTTRTIVTASADRSLKVWSDDDGHLLRTFTHHLEAVNALVFRPLPGRAAGDSPPCACASASDDRTLRIWQPEIGRMVRIIRQHRAPALALVYSPDGQSLFSAGQEGVIRCFEADSDALRSEWPAHNDWIYALAIDARGAKLASGDWSGTVKLHDVPAR